MAIPTDYASLQTWLLDWSNRPDFSSKVPEFIALAEAEMTSRLRVRQNEVTGTLTLTQGGDSVALPSGYSQLISLNVADALEPQPQQREVELLDRLRASTAQLSGRPRAYAIVGSGTVIFDVTADVSYPIEIRYYRKLDIATDLTNWVLTGYPAIYLGLCLKWASMYVKEPNGSAVWMAEADKQINLLVNADMRDRMKGVTARVDGALTGRSGYNISTDSFGGSL